ncbi:MAG TPA: hypothetical protein VF211_07580 [Burkholderiales bacterium]
MAAARAAAVLALAALLAGCASSGANLQRGVSDEAAVRAEMGAPAETVALASGGRALFYPRGFRDTIRVELGPDGKVRAVEHVLDERYFDRIVKGKTTREEVRAMLGPPFHVWRLGSGEILWEYRYVWAHDEPWTLLVGIGEDGIVTGQARHQERDAGPGFRR